MPFTASTLYKVGGAEPGLWLYTNADLVATIAASGYFNTVTDSIKRNDIILAVSGVGGTPLVDVLVVTSATGAATVTTTNGT